MRAGLIVFRRPRLGATATVAQLSAWALQCLSCWVLLVALGLDKHAGIGAAAAVLFAVNITAVLPATPANLGVFQAACAAVLHTGWHISYGDGVAFGVILQAVEVTTAILMGMPALLKEGMSWREVRLRAMHTTPVKLPARPSSRGGRRRRGRPARAPDRQASAIAGSPSSPSGAPRPSRVGVGQLGQPRRVLVGAGDQLVGRLPVGLGQEARLHPEVDGLRVVGDDRERRLLGLDREAARQPQPDRRRVEQPEHLLVL